jgi:hypothetical protein
MGIALWITARVEDADRGFRHGDERNLIFNLTSRLFSIDACSHTRPPPMLTMVVVISKPIKDLMVSIIIHLQPVSDVQEQLIACG